MADDIDDLLDEVETKFCVKDDVKKKKKSVASNSKPQNKIKKKTAEDDDLNDVINDIIDVPDPLDDIGPCSVDTDKRSRNTSNQSKKCIAVYLGGSSASVGVASATTQRTCDQLRCTSCDFKLVYYDNFEWDKTCDYLFFRNNVPDFKKLSAKLKKKMGCRAYACQCKWRSIKSITAVGQDAELKWVCGKHAS